RSSQRVDLIYVGSTPSYSPLLFSLLFYCYGDHRDLHSFPTRRSSDLAPRAAESTPRARERRRTASLDSPPPTEANRAAAQPRTADRKSTRLNSSHVAISYAVFCLKKKTKRQQDDAPATPTHPVGEPPL